MYHVHICVNALQFLLIGHVYVDTSTNIPHNTQRVSSELNRLIFSKLHANQMDQCLIFLNYADIFRGYSDLQQKAHNTL